MQVNIKEKAFKLFDPIEKKVVVSRNEQINEKSAWNWNNQKEVMQVEEKGKSSTAAPTIIPSSSPTFDDKEEPRQ